MTKVEARLHRLEAKVQRQEQMFSAHEQCIRKLDDISLLGSNAPTSISPDHNANFHSSGTNDSRSAGVQELSPEEASTDGMAITYTDEEDSGYFGHRHLSCDP